MLKGLKANPYRLEASRRESQEKNTAALPSPLRAVECIPGRAWPATESLVFLAMAAAAIHEY